MRRFIALKVFNMVLVARQSGEPQAAVLPENLPEGEACDWVEGAETLADLVEFIESGDYEALAYFEGSEEEWQEHEGCSCGCQHQ